MSSRRGGLSSLGALHRAFFAGLVGIALIFATAMFQANPADAQRVYGGSSYGSELYSAEAENRDVLPPNTGFQVVAQAATEQPVLFWGSSAAIVLALVTGALTVRNIVKRKQEN